MESKGQSEEKQKTRDKRVPGGGWAEKVGHEIRKQERGQWEGVIDLVISLHSALHNLRTAPLERRCLFSFYSPLQHESEHVSEGHRLNGHEKVPHTNLFIREKKLTLSQLLSHEFARQKSQKAGKHTNAAAAISQE